MVEKKEEKMEQKKREIVIINTVQLKCYKVLIYLYVMYLHKDTSKHSCSKVKELLSQNPIVNSWMLTSFLVSDLSESEEKLLPF